MVKASANNDFIFILQKFDRKVTKSREQNKRIHSFFCRDGVTSRLESAKLRKKVVVTKRFWKINAFRPEIKARRGRKRKFNLGHKANWGGLVKELGFQIVTSFSHLLHLCDDAFEARQQFFVGIALN